MLDFVQSNLNKYLHDPNLNNFLELRTTYLKSPVYTPYVNYMDSASVLLGNEQYPEALDYLKSVLPGFFLSPSFHRILAFIYHQLFRIHEEYLERNLADSLLHGILSSGDGSEQHPYLVLYVGDEYEVLAHLGKKHRLQQLVMKEGCSFDLLTCDDDGLLWFDVTAMLNRQAGNNEEQK